MPPFNAQRAFDRAFAIAGLSAARFIVGRAERVRGHAHPNAHAFFLLRGGMEEDGIGLERGGVRLSGVDAVHNIDFGADGGDCLTVHYRDPGVRGSRFFQAGRFASIGPRIARNLETPASYPAAVVAAIQGLALLRWPEHTFPDWLDEAWLQLSGAGATVRVQDVARSVGVSREHLVRRFQQRFSVAPNLVRQLARLEFACGLLHHQPIVDVAVEAGYADQSHMTRVFQRALGHSPARFAQALRVEEVTKIQDEPRKRS